MRVLRSGGGHPGGGAGEGGQAERQELHLFVELTLFKRMKKFVFTWRGIEKDRIKDKFPLTLSVGGVGHPQQWNT